MERDIGRFWSVLLYSPSHLRGVWDKGAPAKDALLEDRVHDALGKGRQRAPVILPYIRRPRMHKFYIQMTTRRFERAVLGQNQILLVRNTTISETCQAYIL